MARFPSRFRRLDEILADLPIDDPMLLSELDGYLTAIAVCAEPVAVEEWLPPIWGGNYGEGAPFEDPIDVRLFAEMVLARYGEIQRDLDRGKLQPIFEVEARNGEVLFEFWIDGFQMAMALRPESWSAIADGEDADAAAALAGLRMLIDIAGDQSPLTSLEINAICDAAPEQIPLWVARLHTARTRDARAERDDRPVKAGRNAPCPCGSGKKHKRCCGMN